MTAIKMLKQIFLCLVLLVVVSCGDESNKPDIDSLIPFDEDIAPNESVTFDFVSLNGRYAHVEDDCERWAFEEYINIEYLGFSNTTSPVTYVYQITSPKGTVSYAYTYLNAVLNTLCPTASEILEHSENAEESENTEETTAEEANVRCRYENFCSLEINSAEQKWIMICSDIGQEGSGGSCTVTWQR